MRAHGLRQLPPWPRKVRLCFCSRRQILPCAVSLEGRSLILLLLTRWWCRTYLTFDLIRRMLEDYFGYTVTAVIQNESVSPTVTFTATEDATFTLVVITGATPTLRVDTP